MLGLPAIKDPQFKKQYPDFSAISRFGIGVLSAFMVADTVEIITVHPEEEKARLISLRSVHGKYLIQMLDKRSDSIDQIGPHGTLIKLKIRPSADMPDIVESARRWIVVPDCDVLVSMDEAAPLLVGFSSPKKALINILQKEGISVDEGAGVEGIRKVKVQREGNKWMYSCLCSRMV